MRSKGHVGIGMEGFIAHQYDKSAKRNMSELYRTWAQQISEQIKDETRVLEIGFGPGYLSIQLAKLGNYKITGLDISETFVAIAKNNAREAKVNIDFRQGNVSSMPFGNEEFDFLVCTSSFKNFSEPLKALKEMYRVLKPGGKGWVSDLRKDISDETINSFVKDTMNMKGLGGYFMKYTFKHTLRPRAYTASQLRDLFSKIQFKEYNIKENQVDIEISFEK